MSDVEILTYENHERARKEELGERWLYLKRLRERRERARKDGMLVCFFTGAFSCGAATTFLTFGDMTAVLIFSIVAMLTGAGAWMLWEAR